MPKCFLLKRRHGHAEKIRKTSDIEAKGNVNTPPIKDKNTVYDFQIVNPKRTISEAFAQIEESKTTEDRWNKRGKANNSSQGPKSSDKELHFTAELKSVKTKNRGSKPNERLLANLPCQTSSKCDYFNKQLDVRNGQILFEFTLILGTSVAETTSSHTSNKASSGQRHQTRQHAGDLCEKSIKKKSYLTKHQNNHKGKTFQCSVCQKWFSRKTSLISHERIHTGEKPFACKICKTFIRECTLKMHKRTRFDERLYQCDVCAKTFKQPSSLSRHKQIHTEG